MVDQIDPPHGPLLGPDEYKRHFNASNYLNEFYSKHNNEPAMHLVLTLLPSIALRLPHGKRLLDVGSGPTVHVAFCFRHSMDAIYLSDFSPDSRRHLFAWFFGYNCFGGGGKIFDWSSITKFVAEREGQPQAWTVMDDEARSKVKGILPCDILQRSVIPMRAEQRFDVVTSFYCLEAACQTIAEYRAAVDNVCRLIEPGGHLVLGGLLQQTWYKTSGRCYKCLALDRRHVFDALRAAGMHVDVDVDHQQHNSPLYFEHEDIFLLVAEKSA